MVDVAAHGAEGGRRRMHPDEFEEKIRFQSLAGITLASIIEEYEGCLDEEEHS